MGKQVDSPIFCNEIQLKSHLADEFQSSVYLLSGLWSELEKHGITVYISP